MVRTNGEITAIKAEKTHLGTWIVSLYIKQNANRTGAWYFWDEHASLRVLGKKLLESIGNSPGEKKTA